MIDTCHYIFVQTHRVNNNVSDGLWMIMMRQCSFIGEQMSHPGGVCGLGEAVMCGSREFTGNLCAFPSIFV